MSWLFRKCRNQMPTKMEDFFVSKFVIIGNSRVWIMGEVIIICTKIVFSKCKKQILSEYLNILEFFQICLCILKALNLGNICWQIVAIQYQFPVHYCFRKDMGWNWSNISTHAHLIIMVFFQNNCSTKILFYIFLK